MKCHTELMKKTAYEFREVVMGSSDVHFDHSIGSSSSTCFAEFMPYATIDTCFLTSSDVTRPFRALWMASTTPPYQL